MEDIIQVYIISIPIPHNLNSHVMNNRTRIIFPYLSYIYCSIFFKTVILRMIQYFDQTCKNVIRSGCKKFYSWKLFAPSLCQTNRFNLELSDLSGLQLTFLLDTRTGLFSIPVTWCMLTAKIRFNVSVTKYFHNMYKGIAHEHAHA